MSSHNRTLALEEMSRLKLHLNRVKKSIRQLYDKEKEHTDIALEWWYKMYDAKQSLKNNPDPDGYVAKDFKRANKWLRKKERDLWHIQDLIVEQESVKGRIQDKLYTKFNIMDYDRPMLLNGKSDSIPYEENYFPTPAKFKGDYEGKTALIIGAGPTSERLFKYQDRLREKFDVIVGINGTPMDFPDMDFNVVMDRMSYKSLKDLGWFGRDADRKLPRILNYPSVHRFPQDLNIIQTRRNTFGGKPNIREFAIDGHEGLLAGDTTRAGLAAGAILTQAIHFVGILGCEKLYLIGTGFLFDDEKDHYNGDKLYRENVLKTKPRNRSLIVEIEHKGKKYLTLEYFLDNAEYINEILIPKICVPGGMDVFDFSGGLLLDEIQVDLDKFMEE